MYSDSDAVLANTRPLGAVRENDKGNSAPDQVLLYRRMPQFGTLNLLVEGSIPSGLTVRRAAGSLMAGHHFTSNVLSERSESKDQPPLLIACEGLPRRSAKGAKAGLPLLTDLGELRPGKPRCSHSFLSASWRQSPR
jgi:hypothetical protein